MSTSCAIAPSASSRRDALRAADALQLAAALVLNRERPRNRDFVTADGDLARAAASEGFRVVVPRT